MDFEVRIIPGFGTHPVLRVARTAGMLILLSRDHDFLSFSHHILIHHHPHSYPTIYTPPLPRPPPPPII